MSSDYYTWYRGKSRQWRNLESLDLPLIRSGIRHFYHSSAYENEHLLEEEKHAGQFNFDEL